MTYCSYEALVRRAVRDHYRVGGAHWVTTTPPPEGALREALRASYGAWLRTTAITGLASALLAPSTAVASPPANAPSMPGIPETNPQAVQSPRLDSFHLDALKDTPKVDPRPQALLKDLVEDQTEDTADRDRRSDAPQAQAQPDQRHGKPVSPPQIPLPARRMVTTPAPPLTAPKQAPPRPAVAGEAPSILLPNRVGDERIQPPTQRLGRPSAAEERRITGPRSATPERVDQWVTAVRTAMQRAPKRQTGSASPTVVTLTEVSPTPRMGWSYRVQAGDSLWRISTQLWADSTSNHNLDRTWRILHEWNRDALGPDSSRIYPGQVLEIPADAQHITTTLPAERVPSGIPSHPVREPAR